MEQQLGYAQFLRTSSQETGQTKNKFNSKYDLLSQTLESYLTDGSPVFKKQALEVIVPCCEPAVRTPRTVWTRKCTESDSHVPTRRLPRRFLRLFPIWSDPTQPRHACLAPTRCTAWKVKEEVRHWSASVLGLASYPWTMLPTATSRALKPPPPQRCQSLQLPP